MKDYSTIGKQYAEDVVSGKIDVCKLVQLACRRQLDDLHRSGDWKYQFDHDKANRVCKFIELLPHVKGKWDTKNIVLEPWQCFILTSIFGWTDNDGLRRFRVVFIEVPRKNSKSTLSAGVGLYCLSLDNEMGSEVYSAATTRDQARIVFGIARQMVRKTPSLQRAYKIIPGVHSLFVDYTASHFEPLSADAGTLEGKSPHCALIDELHAHKTREVFDVLDTATSARKQPLLWTITTAGSNRAGICYEQHLYVKKILEGVLSDDRVFGIIYSIDNPDAWTEEESWKAANPNYGVSVNPEDIKRKCKRAQEIHSSQSTFLTKHLNIWVNADSSWMDMGKWDKCGDSEVKIEDFHGEPCWIALDLSSKIDIAAMLVLFKRAGKFYPFLKAFVPQDAVDKSETYKGWERSGHLIATPGNVIDFSYIEEELQKAKGMFEIQEVPFDPFQATQLSTRMLAEGFPMVEFGQTVKNLSEPMKELEAIVLSEQVIHDGNPVLGWMISNVVCHRDAKDNIFPRKEKLENKIDGAVAFIMALARANASTDDQMSIYATQEMMLLDLENKDDEDDKEFLELLEVD